MDIYGREGTMDGSASNPPRTPSYYDEAAWVSEGTIGAWTLVVGHFPEHDSYCVDHYSRADGRKQRLYFATKAEALAHAQSFGRR